MPINDDDLLASSLKNTAVDDAAEEDTVAVPKKRPGKLAQLSAASMQKRQQLLRALGDVQEVASPSAKDYFKANSNYLDSLPNDVGISLLQGLAPIGLIGTLPYDKVTSGNFFGPASQGLSKWANEQEQKKSMASQIANAEIAQAGRAAEDAVREKLGDNLGSDIASTLAGFGVAAANSAMRPETIPSFLAQQLPQYGLMYATGGGTAALTGAAAKAMPKLAATKLGQKVIENSAVAGAIGTGATLQGIDSGSDAMTRLMEMPEKKWKENPEYVALAKEIGPDAAKQQIASELASKATAKAGIASLVSMLVPGMAGVERSLVGKNAVKVRDLPKVVGKEFLQEGWEEGTGQYFGNEAVQQVDPEQRLMEGVGTNAGIGAYMGGIAGGVIHTGSAAKSAVFDSAINKAKGALDGAKDKLINEATKEASSTGDVSKLLDAKASTFAPHKAIEALHAFSEQESTTPEAKNESLTKAEDIRNGLKIARDQVQEIYDSLSPETVADLTKSLEGFKAKGDQAKVKETQELLDDIAQNQNRVEPLKKKIESLDKQLEAADKAMELFTGPVNKTEDQTAETKPTTSSIKDMTDEQLKSRLGVVTDTLKKSSGPNKDLRVEEMVLNSEIESRKQKANKAATTTDTESVGSARLNNIADQAYLLRKQIAEKQKVLDAVNMVDGRQLTEEQAKIRLGVLEQSKPNGKYDPSNLEVIQHPKNKFAFAIAEKKAAPSAEALNEIAGLRTQLDELYKQPVKRQLPAATASTGSPKPKAKATPAKAETELVGDELLNRRADRAYFLRKQISKLKGVLNVVDKRAMTEQQAKIRLGVLQQSKNASNYDPAQLEVIPHPTQKFSFAIAEKSKPLSAETTKQIETLQTELDGLSKLPAKATNNKAKALVDERPMTEKEANIRLQILKSFKGTKVKYDHNKLAVVPHPTAKGAFAIAEQEPVAPAPPVKEPVENKTPEEHIQDLKSDDKETRDSAVESIINLSMASPSSIDTEAIKEILEDPEVQLDGDQIYWLNRFVETRATEHVLKSTKGVNKDILDGPLDEKYGFVGTNTYRKEVTQALQAGDIEFAQRLVGKLTNFAGNHMNKAETVKKAVQAFKQKGKELFVIYDTDSNRWVQAPVGTTMSNEKRKLLGAVKVNALTEKGLLPSLLAKSAVVEATANELQALIELKTKSQGSNNGQNISQTRNRSQGNQTGNQGSSTGQTGSSQQGRSTGSSSSTSTKTTQQAISAQEKGSLQIVANDSSNYVKRTEANAKEGDVSIGYAADFSTPGEKATKKLVLKFKKAYLPFHEKFDGSSIDAFVSDIVKALKKVNGKFINVTGNDIATWFKNDETVTQEWINQEMYNLLSKVKDAYPELEGVVTGGQSGSDIAGAVAARALGLTVKVHMPSGYKARGEDGQDFTQSAEDVKDYIESSAQLLLENNNNDEGTPPPSSGNNTPSSTPTGNATGNTDSNSNSSTPPADNSKPTGKYANVKPISAWTPYIDFTLDGDYKVPVEGYPVTLKANDSDYKFIAYYSQDEKWVVIEQSTGFPLTGLQPTIEKAVEEANQNLKTSFKPGEFGSVIVRRPKLEDIKPLSSIGNSSNNTPSSQSTPPPATPPAANVDITLDTVTSILNTDELFNGSSNANLGREVFVKGIRNQILYIAKFLKKETSVDKIKNEVEQFFGEKFKTYIAASEEQKKDFVDGVAKLIAFANASSKSINEVSVPAATASKPSTPPAAVVTPPAATTSTGGSVPTIVTSSNNNNSNTSEVVDETKAREAESVLASMAQVIRQKAKIAYKKEGKDFVLTVDGKEVGRMDEAPSTAFAALKVIGKLYADLMKQAGKVVPTDPIQMTRDQFVVFNELTPGNIVKSFEVEDNVGIGKEGSSVIRNANGTFSVNHDVLYDRIQAQAGNNANNNKPPQAVVKPVDVGVRNEGASDESVEGDTGLEEEVDETEEVTETSPPPNAKVSAEPAYTALKGVKAAAGTAYNLLNLVTEFFKAKQSIPLGRFKDLYTALHKSNYSDTSLLNTDHDITDNEKNLLKLFTEKASVWGKMLDDELITFSDKRKPHQYKDLSRFLINESADGKLSFDQNTKTAIMLAAFNYIIDNANDDGITTEEKAAKLFGLQEDKRVDPVLFKQVYKQGLLDKLALEELGSSAYAFSGLKIVDENAPINLEANMKAALGARALRLLLKEGIVVENSIDISPPLDGNPQEETGEEAKKHKNENLTTFYKFARPSETKHYADIQKILDTHKQAPYFLTKAFGGVQIKSFPGENPEFTQKTANKSDRSIPDLHKAVGERTTKIKWKVNEDIYTVLANLYNEETEYQDFLALMGANLTPANATHIDNVEKYDAEFESSRRALENAVQFVQDIFPTFSTGRDGATFSLTPAIWKQQRAGYLDNMVDPQMIKAHRYMFQQASWTTSLDVTDIAAKEAYLTRIGEALGFTGTDQHILAETKERVQEQDFKDGIATLNKIFNTKLKPSPEGIEALKKAVAKGGENLWTLQGMIAYMKIQNAEQAIKKAEKAGTEKPSAFVDLVLNTGTDGVSSGVILSHLLLGASRSVEELLDVLRRGGGYQNSDGVDSYHEWHSIAGNYDMYEYTTEGLQKLLAGSGIDKNITSAIYKVTKDLFSKVELEDEGKVEGLVTKDGRKFAKGIIPPIIFGSSMFRASESLEDSFINNVAKGFERLVGKSNEEVQEYVAALNLLMTTYAYKNKTTGEPILSMLYKPNRPLSYYLNLRDDQSPWRESALRRAFKNTLGNTMKQATEHIYGKLMEQQSQVANLSILSFGLYDAVLEGERQKLLEDPSVIKNNANQPLHDITKKQLKELKKKLYKLAPIVQTLASKKSGRRSAGINMSKSKNVENPAVMYAAEINYSTPPVQTKEGKNNKNIYSSARVRRDVNPGVAMSGQLTHSFDAYVSLSVQNMFETLNMHDELVTNANDIKAVSRELNRVTFQSAIEYSPLRELYQAQVNAILGLDALIKKGELSQQSIENLLQMFKDTQAQMEKKKIFGWNWKDFIIDARANAYEADKLKLNTMLKLDKFNHYAMDGGTYEVTAEDRAAIQAELDKLSDQKKVPKKVLEAIDRVLAVVDAKGVLNDSAKKPVARTTEPVTPTSTPFGELKDNGLSDKRVVEYFKNNENTTVGGMVEFLGKDGILDSPLNKTILKLLSKIVNKNTTVKLITSQTKESDVVAKPNVPSRAWYVGSALYFTGSEFSHANLTPEVMLHELVHHALVNAINNPVKGSKVLVTELTRLMKATEKYIKDNNIVSGDFLAVFNTPEKDRLHEFLAWGMTNKEFQDTVLKNVQFENKTDTAKLVKTGWEAFKRIISNFLYSSYASSKLENGLEALFTNVSGLIEGQNIELNGSTDGQINLSMAASTSQVDSYTTNDVFKALDNGSLSPSFKKHLERVLNSIVGALYGPFGAYAAQLKSNGSTALDAWTNTLSSGQAPLASAISASNFAGSEQENFVMQQVEATVKATIEDNEASTKLAYRELAKLFKETREHFRKNNLLSQQDFDFLFDIQSGNGERSDHLSRFAAIGLANKKFSDMLNFSTATDPVNTDTTMFGKLKAWFSKVLNHFNNKVTNTYGGQLANKKLETLVGKLVEIENKKRKSIQTRNKDYMGNADKALQSIGRSARGAVTSLAKSSVVQNSKISMVKAATTAASLIANNQMGEFFDAVKKARDIARKDAHGFVMSMVNEIKGPTAKLDRLLRMTKKIEQMRDSLITQQGKLALSTYANEGVDLTTEDKSAITSVFLRTGLHHLLGDFSMIDIAKIVGSRNELAKAIAKVEGKLTGKAVNRYIEQANGLGFFKANERAVIPVLMLNAHMISRLSGTPFAKQISEADAKANEKYIAQLASLYALKYSRSADLKKAHSILTTELGRSDGNGVEFTLGVHKKMEQDALETVFNNNPALMIHGYTPEIQNPHTKIVVAGTTEGANLVAQGYVQGEVVPQDISDPYPEERRIYVLRDGGLKPWLSGIISLTSTANKGTSIHNGFMNVNTLDGLENASLQASVTKNKFNQLKKNVLDPRRDLSSNSGNFLVPTYDDTGEISNWRYMMKRETRDNILERDSRFDNVIGVLAGTTFDKDASRKQNKTVIKALKEDWDAKKTLTDKASFIEVSAKSADKEMREHWRMLPDETKKDIFNEWGGSYIMVPKDSVKILFGYRKMSAVNFLTSDEQLEGFQKSLRNFFDAYARSKGMNANEANNYAKRIGHILSRGGDIWQALMKEVKTNIVIKSGVVLLGNEWSNWSQLAIAGVPVKDILSDRFFTIQRSAEAYQNDKRELNVLETKLSVGYTGNDRKGMEQRVKELRDSIDRNPARDLIEAGLMPTIVEDISTEEDPYSYKSYFNKKIEKYTSKIPKGVKNAGKQIYMARDTEMFKFLNRQTQLSDFAARYTLYHHLTSGPNPMSREEALFEVSESFINYDVPMHKVLQYGDDMGVLMFSKYFFRIQRVIAKLFKEHPARAITAVALDQFLNLGPIIMESSFMHHLGNTGLNSGILQFPSSVGGIATIRAGMGLLK